MNRLRRNWLLMLDEPRYRGLRGNPPAPPEDRIDWQILDIQSVPLRLDLRTPETVIDIRGEP